MGNLVQGILQNYETAQVATQADIACYCCVSFSRFRRATFFPELDDLSAEEPSEDEKIALALRSSSLPEDVQDHIQWLIKAIRKQKDKQE